MSGLCAELNGAWARDGVAVTFGVFDGVHRGHLHVIKRLKSVAEKYGYRSAVVTLSNHPLTVLRPHVPLRLITSVRERLELLRATGVDVVVPINFSRELSLLSAADFMTALRDCMNMMHFVVGPDFALGHNREGTSERLAELGSQLGYSFEAAEPLEIDGAPARSTGIRQALSAGDPELAARLLGRPFVVDGPVVEGEGRGSGLLGFPTANIGLGPLQALPADGIYASWLSVGGRRYPAATSIGIKPTFHSDGPRVVEAFVLDFDGNLYGEHVRLEFVSWLRQQERFDCVDDLVQQIASDVERTRNALTATPTEQADLQL